MTTKAYAPVDTIVRIPMTTKAYAPAQYAFIMYLLLLFELACFATW